MIDPHTYLHQPDRITIAESARIDWGVRVNGGQGLTIGEHVHIASGCVVNAGNGTLYIGDHSGLSNNVVVAAGLPDLRYQYISAADPPEKQHPVRLRTTIGQHVVIFANATILPGVTIGDYAVIGAGAVVTKDVPPYAVVMGVPGRVVGRREWQDGELRTVYYPKLRELSAQRDMERVQAHYREAHGVELPEAVAVDLVEVVDAMTRELVG